MQNIVARREKKNNTKEYLAAIWMATNIAQIAQQ